MFMADAVVVVVVAASATAADISRACNWYIRYKYRIVFVVAPVAVIVVRETVAKLYIWIMNECSRANNFLCDPQTH